MNPLAEQVGIVIIGRNEGARLKRCLESVAGTVDAIVYVDSGSTDGSVAAARSAGVTVVELDMAVPFTAARARNAGFRALRAVKPELEYVQFVDGDCSVVADWLEHGRKALEARTDVAIVSGRRRERSPSASIYNRLCDMEWNGPIGRTKRLCGDMMIRAGAFESVQGFREDLIAGEEADLCVRLGDRGWSALRIGQEMTIHDADIHRFSQWWRRAVRTGHAYTEGAWIHGLTRKRHNLRQVASITFWGGVLPLAAVLPTTVTSGLSLVLLATYPALWLRIRRSRIERGDPPSDANVYSTFCLLGKFAELTGVVQFAWHRLVRHRPSTLIEYKGPQ